MSSLTLLVHVVSIIVHKHTNLPTKPLNIFINYSLIKCYEMDFKCSNTHFQFRFIIGLCIVVEDKKSSGGCLLEMGGYSGEYRRYTGERERDR